MVDFAKQLKSVRRQQGMTQRELGEFLGIGQTAIANYEQGTRVPDALGLYKIAEVLHVSMDELLGRGGPALKEIAEYRSLKTYQSPDTVDFQYEIDSYIELILEGQSITATSRIIEIAGLGITVSTIYRRILEPIFYRAKKPSAAESLSIYQEQAIIQGMRSVMELLKEYIIRKPPNGKRLLGTTVDGETSNVELSMISNFMHLEGWEVMCLGNYLSATEIIEAARIFKPDVIALFIDTSSGIDSAATLISALGSLKALTLAGGEPFSASPGLWQRIHASAYAPRVLEAASLLTKLM